MEHAHNNGRSQYLTVQRYAFDSTDPVSRGAVKRAAQLGLCAKTVLDRYRGFEAAHVLAAQEPQSSTTPGERLWITTDPEPKVPTGFSFLGYECGVFESSDNFYSVVFHEVVFGLIDALTAFRNLLNDVLLFSSANVAKDLLAVRSNVGQATAEIESFPIGERCEVWTVFAGSAKG